jgi:hypothetical protein
VADALPRLAARTDDEVRVWDTLSELRPREGQLEQCKHGWPVELAAVNTLEKKASEV